MKNLLFFPFGGNTREAISIAIAQNKILPQWKILGFVDDNKGLTKSCWNLSILGGREILSQYHDAYVIAAPGRPDNYWKRQKIIESLKVNNQRWATLIHPNVDLAIDSQVGYNTIIMAGCVISIGVSIGNHCVLLPNTVVSHDASIGDYTIVGSNVSISGGVHIGNLCYIGSGSRLIQEIKIGNGALIGLGSVVINSIPTRTIAAGCPAKILRNY